MGWRAFLKNFRNSGSEADALEAMIRASREDGAGGTLSPAARERILSEAMRVGPATGRFSAVFVPTRRLLLAGALPVALAAALLVGLVPSVPVAPRPGDSAPVVAVFKQGDRVFFDIRNGARGHVVYRSTHPGRFDHDSAVPVTDGAFEDGLQDQADLVFYRID